jgi:hypothetical protein
MLQEVIRPRTLNIVRIRHTTAPLLDDSKQA